MQVSPASQVLPQVPQWLLLVLVFTQVLPQQVVPPVHPAPLPQWQVPPEQVSFRPQGWSQPPQWVVLLEVSTQEVPQQVRPPVQSFPVPPHLQLPPTQVSPVLQT
jgi:hypothetical protein